MTKPPQWAHRCPSELAKNLPRSQRREIARKAGLASAEKRRKNSMAGKSIGQKEETP